MNRRIRLPLGMALGLAACCVAVSGCLVKEQGAASATRQTASTPRAAEFRGEPSGAAEEGAYDQVVVTVTLPAKGDPLPEPISGHGPSCPQGKVSSILGIGITSPHGIIVGRLLPEGPAAKAGLRTGDGIIEAGGVEVTCPSTLLPRIEPSAEPRDIEFTVRREKAAAKSVPAEDAQEQQAQESE